MYEANRNKFVRELEADSKSGEAKLSDGDSMLRCYGLEICDGQTNARFYEDDNEHGYFQWELALGPANSKKLIEFLRGLPPELDWPEEERCPQCNNENDIGAIGVFISGSALSAEYVCKVCRVRFRKMGS